ncbi:MAG: RNA methyltransferase [Bacteroidetes bacterium]|jgi:TrmH family RNA methyltransferase|nr:RNA methyltransferase [Bacteroidota bacterium]
MRSLSNRRRKEIAALSRKKHRDARDEYVVEGIRGVEAALDADAPLVDVVVQDEGQADPVIQSVIERVPSTVPVQVVSDDDMARLSNVATSQGLLAVVRAVRLPPERLTERSTVLALDGVQDPGNVGTLLRTAAWFGIEAVLTGPGTADVYHPKVVRAAMGAHWDVALAQSDALGPVLDAMQQAGFGLYGADLVGTPVAAWQPRQPAVLVVGSEAHGLSAAVLERLHEPVAIPGAARRQGTESLNVAVAAGILMYAWRGPIVAG